MGKSKMSKRDQHNIAITFANINNMYRTSLVQDIMNTKALDDYEEPTSYKYLYTIDELIDRLYNAAFAYTTQLEKEQKVIPELFNSLKDPYDTTTTTS